MKGMKMNDFLPAMIAGMIFATGGMLFFGFLITIGILIEWVEKRWE